MLDWYFDFCIQQERQIYIMVFGNEMQLDSLCDETADSSFFNNSHPAHFQGLQ